MKPEEQNLAIAKAAEHSKDFFCPEHGTVPRDRVEGENTCPWCGSDCDDELFKYTEDLNAMHEAEKILSPLQILEYAELLSSKLGSHSYIKASAAQRAEAFLKTLNLWTE